MSKIKPIPTPEEIENALEHFRKDLEHVGQITTLESALKQALKTLTPAQKVQLFILEEGKEHLLDSEGRSHPFATKKRSFLVRSLHSPTPIYTNDVRRDPDYDETMDNPSNYPVKSLLSYALHYENDEGALLIWAAIPLRDLNQFVRGDAEIVEQFIKLIPEELISLCLQDLVSAHPPNNDKDSEEESKKLKQPNTTDTNASSEDHSVTISTPKDSNESNKPQKIPSPASKPTVSTKRSSFEAPTIIKAIRSLLKSKKR